MRSLDELRAIAEEVQTLLANKGLSVIECLFILSLLHYVIFNTIIEAGLAGQLRGSEEAA